MIKEDWLSELWYLVAEGTVRREDIHLRSGIQGHLADLYVRGRPAIISRFDLANPGCPYLCVYIDDNIIALIRHAGN